MEVQSFQYFGGNMQNYDAAPAFIHSQHCLNKTVAFKDHRYLFELPPNMYIFLTKHLLVYNLHQTLVCNLLSVICFRVCCIRTVLFMSY